MDKTNRQFCFKHPGGEDIYLFTLSNSKGSKTRITNYGAIITAFIIHTKENANNNIVLGFDDVKQYMSPEYLKAYPYFGAAIGRYGNRIKSGKFSIDGKHYDVGTNLGTEHLHGGFTGLDKRVWKVESYNHHSLSLSYLSPDGEEGYPGNLNISIRFELTEDNALSYEYKATTDSPTPINLTHHSYFNLDDIKGTIEKTKIQINADSILEQDDTLTVTGKLISVKDSKFDFRKQRSIDSNWDPANGFDQSFVVDKVGIENLAAEACSDSSGLNLQVFTTEPIVHLYTGRWIPEVKGSGGNSYGPYSGFCLETQVHPNAVNISSFPNTVLRPGEVYHHKTIYKVFSNK